MKFFNSCVYEVNETGACAGGKEETKERKRDIENWRGREAVGEAPAYHVAQSHSYVTSHFYIKTQRVFYVETVLHKDPFAPHRPPNEMTLKRRLSS